MSTDKKLNNAFVAAFPHTIPIMAGFLFLGISYGIYAGASGLSFIYPLAMSFTIFGLCDETFSINCSVTPPDNVDKGWFMFFVTLLNQLYWVLGATIGGILGSLIEIDLKGIEFVMTAMFVVIFLEQWLKDYRGISSLETKHAYIHCRRYFQLYAYR